MKPLPPKLPLHPTKLPHLLALHTCLPSHGITSLLRYLLWRHLCEPLHTQLLLLYLLWRPLHPRLLQPHHLLRLLLLHWLLPHLLHPLLLHLLGLLEPPTQPAYTSGPTSAECHI